LLALHCCLLLLLLLLCLLLLLPAAALVVMASSPPPAAHHQADSAPEAVKCRQAMPQAAEVTVHCYNWGERQAASKGADAG
jgi:ABC-type sulfate transport system permease component